MHGYFDQNNQIFKLRAAKRTGSEELSAFTVKAFENEFLQRPTRLQCLIQAAQHPSGSSKLVLGRPNPVHEQDCMQIHAELIASADQQAETSKARKGEEATASADKPEQPKKSSKGVAQESGESGTLEPHDPEEAIIWPKPGEVDAWERETTSLSRRGA